jgi:two-component system chemotaxis response regulator CheB
VTLFEPGEQSTHEPLSRPPGYPAETTRNIVVVGASAGGIEVVQRLFRDLGNQPGAAFFVVVHMAPDAPSALPAIIARRTPMLVKQPALREPVREGVVYVARPDFHLQLEGKDIVVTHGPRENRYRPSIDTLFRSAAQWHGAQVVGVVLSGNLRDGAAGLDAISNAGGVAVIQDPADASYAGMPLAAMSAVPEAHVVRLAEIGTFLGSLLPHDVDLEGRTLTVEEQAAKAAPTSIDNPEQHPPSRYTCPDCGGTLFRIDEGTGHVISFHCRVGHRYSGESLFEAQEDNVEDALWASLRAMEERIDLANTMAERARQSGRQHSAEFFARKAEQAIKRADTLRRLLGSNGARSGLVPEDAEPDEMAGASEDAS